jgi:hypothetical protein
MQKWISYTYSLVLAADMHATGFKKKSIGWCLGKLYKDKILLVVESCFGYVSFPQFNLRLSSVAYDVEQDFLGRWPNSDTFLTEMYWASSSGELGRKGDLKAEKSRNVYHSHAICIHIVRHGLELAYHDVTTPARSHQCTVPDLWKTGWLSITVAEIFLHV